MKIAVLVARILLGLIFFVFGLNGFFHFLPQPQMGDEAAKFMMGLAGSGYFFPFLKICETLSGALLLAGVYVPLALLILSPIVVNIFLFHLFLDHAGLPIAILLVVLMIFLGYAYREYYKSIFTHKAEI
ncbi:MAG: hypothetical protein KatS3mg129_1786 [Leptospiraceae bacterium]|nr:MAG: hypothetical protein KatS3mg129_1786 [Leptospiraceae bacterium]